MAVQAELSERENIYVESLLSGMSKTAALASAGFAATFSSTRLDVKPQVQLALLQGRQKLSQRHKITRDEVVQGMLDAVRMSATAAELVMAWREIGKLLGHYTEEVKITVTQKVEHMHSTKQLENLSTEELAELADMDSSLVLEGEFLAAGEEDAPEHGGT